LPEVYPVTPAQNAQLAPIKAATAQGRGLLTDVLNRHRPQGDRAVVATLPATAP
jgi:hypothetical protein